MMTKQTTRWCCLALFLIFAVDATKRLKGICELPSNVRPLLRWFANSVEIVNDNEIWLHFDPSQSNYGSHHYGNFQGLLEPVARGYQYFTVGNIHQGSFPPYVTEVPESNQARIIVRVRSDNRQRADRVFITRHFEDCTDPGYDPEQTYRLTANQLRQIKEASAHREPTSNPQTQNMQGVHFSNQSFSVPQPIITPDVPPINTNLDDNSPILWAICLFALFVMLVISYQNSNPK